MLLPISCSCYADLSPARWPHTDLSAKLQQMSTAEPPCVCERHFSGFPVIFSDFLSNFSMIFCDFCVCWTIGRVAGDEQAGLNYQGNKWPKERTNTKKRDSPSREMWWWLAAAQRMKHCSKPQLNIISTFCMRRYSHLLKGLFLFSMFY